jgi:O-antigen/teichoic acid export membrane protein
VAALITISLSPAHPLFAFAMAYVISTFVSMLTALFFTMAKTGRPRLSLFPFDFLGGASFALTSFSATVQVESDKLILAFFTTPADVGVYAVASRLMDGLYAPTRALKAVLQPKIYRAGAGGSLAVIKIVLEIIPLIILFGVLAWIGVVLATPFVVWVFGPKYAALGHVLPLIAALPLIRSFAEVGSELFLASDRAAFQSIVQLSTTVMRIVVSIAFIAWMKLDGAIASAIVCAAIVGATYWSVAWIALRRSGISSRAALAKEKAENTYG